MRQVKYINSIFRALRGFGFLICLLSTFNLQAQDLKLFPSVPNTTLSLLQGEQIVQGTSQNALLGCIEGEHTLVIALRYEENRDPIPPDWSVQVKVRLVQDDGVSRGTDNLLMPSDGSESTILTLNQSPDGSHTLLASAMYSDKFVTCSDEEFTYWLEVEEVISTNATDAMPHISLESWLYTREAYGLPSNVNAIMLEGTADGPEFLRVRIDHEDDKAWEWDLEWVYIDVEELGKEVAYPSKEDAFKMRQATRVTITNDVLNANAIDGYLMELTYPKGALYFRARAVGRFVEAMENESFRGQPYYSPSWTYYQGYHELQNGFEKDHNWQVVTTFAEDAKNKKILTYYDGSLRPRQVQTGLSTDGTTLVAESFFDHEGRAAINVLPAPVAGRSLTFKPGFNPFVMDDFEGVDPKNVYDNLESVASIQLDENGSGAGRYYSPKNNLGNIGTHRDYIPNANGYAYTQVRYKNDGTGRIAEQSGVGEAFNLIGGKTTKYFYGSASKEEIQRLFGSNMGKAGYYRKQMVIDPNGQVSVSYLDAADRVIATALAGNKPGNMDAIASYPETGTPLQVNMMPNNYIDQTNRVSITANTFLNPEAGTDFTFTYNLQGAVNQVDLDQDGVTDLCKTCEYQLDIEIIDENGKLVDFYLLDNYIPVDNELACEDVPFEDKTKMSVYSKNITAAECEAGGADIRFCVKFGEIGNYTIVKRLKLLSDPINVLTYLEGKQPMQGKVDELLDALNDAIVASDANCEATAFPEITIDPTDPEKILELEQLFLQQAAISCKLLIESKANYEGEDELLAIIDHHIDACNTHQPSTDYDNSLNDIKDWNEALAAGGVDHYFANPSGISVPSDFESGAYGYTIRNVTVAESPNEVNNLDPFFWKGDNYEGPLMFGFDEMDDPTPKNQMSERMNNLTYFDKNREAYTISIWERLVYKGDKVPEQLREDPEETGCTVCDRNVLFITHTGDFLDENNPTFDAFIAQRRWDLFRGTYLIEKTKLKADLYEKNGLVFDSRLKDVIPDPREVHASNIEEAEEIIAKNYDVFEPDYEYQAQTTLDYLIAQFSQEGCDFDLDNQVHQDAYKEMKEDLVNYFAAKDPADLFGVIYQEDADATCDGVGYQPLCEIKDKLRDLMSACAPTDDDGIAVDTEVWLAATFDKITFKNYFNCAEPYLITASRPAYGFFGTFHKVDKEASEPLEVLQATTANFSIETWLKLDDMNGKPNYTRLPILSRSDTYTDDLNNEVLQGFEFGLTDNYELYFWYNNTEYLSTITLEDNLGAYDCDACNHVAVSYDNGIVRFYHNAIEISAQVNNTYTPANSEGETLLGGVSVDQTLRAYMQDLRVWNRVLTAPELGYDKLAKIPGGGNPNNLLAWWKMDEGSGIELFDQRSGLNAVLANPACEAVIIDSFDDGNCCNFDISNVTNPETYLYDQPFEGEYTFSDWTQQVIHAGSQRQWDNVSSVSTANGTITAGDGTKGNKYFMYLPGGEAPTNGELSNPDLLAHSFFVSPAFDLTKALEATLNYDFHQFFESASSCTNPSANGMLFIREVGSPETTVLNAGSGDIVATSHPYLERATIRINSTENSQYLGKQVEFIFVSNNSCDDQYLGTLIDNFNLEITNDMTIGTYPDCEVVNDKVEEEFNGIDFPAGWVSTPSDAPWLPHSALGYLEVNLEDMYTQSVQQTEFITSCYDLRNLRKPVVKFDLQAIINGLDQSIRQENLPFVQVSIQQDGDVTWISLGSIAVDEAWRTYKFDLSAYSDVPLKFKFVTSFTVGQAGPGVSLDLSGSKLNLDNFKVTSACNPIWLENSCLTREIKLCDINSAELDAILASGYEPDLDKIKEDVIKDCKEEEAARLTDIYHTMINDLKWEYVSIANQQQYDNCFTKYGFSENFSYSFVQKEYHYTLYYYDQSGSLVQTVPPQGVDILNADELQANVEPEHALKTRYAYNTLGQLFWQATPDGGESQFFYDDLGRIRLSQNAKQAAHKDGNGLSKPMFSYTKHDEQGRIIEVGQLEEKIDGSALLEAELLDAIANDHNFPSIADYKLDERTITHYDELEVAPAYFEKHKEKVETFSPENLRGRVAWTEVVDNHANNPAYDYEGQETKYKIATLYSYDVHGNVDKLLNINFAAKEICYDYDLVSGNVKHVVYDQGEDGQFIHRYEYDADNRITNVQTSLDGYIWTQEAAYQYYAHGPLARTELGHYKVQGLDYFYTLQGWIKGVNMLGNGSADDLGKDGTANSSVAKDQFAYQLGYFNGDYSPIKTEALTWNGMNSAWDRFNTIDKAIYNEDDPIPRQTNAVSTIEVKTEESGLINAGDATGTSFVAGEYIDLQEDFEARANFDARIENVDPNGVGRSLFNGNIAWMATDLKAMNNGLQLMGYRYDQLNRIKRGESFKFDGISNSWTQPNEAYKVSYTYDGNGNIERLTRHNGNGDLMDDFSYHYNINATTGQLLNNRLRHVMDWTGSGLDKEAYNESNASTQPTIGGGTLADGKDFASQGIDNYEYDDIGNLIKDEGEGITYIEWTISGKVKEVTKEVDDGQGGTVTVTTYYDYDAAGNRIGKWAEKSDGQKKMTLYIRDASGNIMETYTVEPEKQEFQREFPIYGSSRVGQYRTFESYDLASNALPKQILKGHITLGHKQYEMSNHLGNVLTVISDKKLPSTDESGNLVLASDGLVESFTADVLSMSDYYPFGLAKNARSYKSNEYRYGFNGMEQDEDAASEHYDFGARLYNSSIGRWLSRDPFEKKYPDISPYVFVKNSPLIFIDPNGKEVVVALRGYVRASDGSWQEINLKNKKDLKKAERLDLHVTVTNFKLLNLYDETDVGKTIRRMPTEDELKESARLIKNEIMTSLNTPDGGIINKEKNTLVNLKVEFEDGVEIVDYKNYKSQKLFANNPFIIAIGHMDKARTRGYVIGVNGPSGMVSLYDYISDIMDYNDAEKEGNEPTEGQFGTYEPTPKPDITEWRNRTSSHEMAHILQYNDHNGEGITRTYPLPPTAAQYYIMAYRGFFERSNSVSWLIGIILDKRKVVNSRKQEEKKNE